MSRQATIIELTEAEQAALESWVRSAKTEQRYVLRAQIVLASVSGASNQSIAASLQVREATVCRWRCRFAAGRLPGLDDQPRPGRGRLYDESTDRRILAQLDEPPPAGYSHWTGTLLIGLCRCPRSMLSNRGRSRCTGPHPMRFMSPRMVPPLPRSP